MNVFFFQITFIVWQKYNYIYTTINQKKFWRKKTHKIKYHNKFVLKIIVLNSKQILIHIQKKFYKNTVSMNQIKKDTGFRRDKVMG